MIFQCAPLFDQELFTESCYEKLSVIESCDQAINEGIFDQRVVTTASTYTYSLVMELLDNVKTTLVKLCSYVLSYVNNYILNSAKLVDKYREVLKDRVSKLKEPFSYTYYEYPDSKHYPVVLAATGSISDTIGKLQSNIIEGKWSGDRVATAVDDLIIDFSRKTIGEDVDPFDLKESTKKIVTNHVKGKVDIRFLTKDDIDAFVALMKTYRPLIDEIKRTKSDVEKDYKLLKEMYMKVTKLPGNIRDITKLQTAFDPELAAFKASEEQRFADINVHMSRLFNGYISIYNTAFDTKLKIIQERVDINRAIIEELLRRTNLLAALGTSMVDKNKKPFKYEPKITT